MLFFIRKLFIFPQSDLGCAFCKPRGEHRNPPLFSLTPGLRRELCHFTLHNSGEMAPREGQSLERAGDLHKSPPFSFQLKGPKEGPVNKPYPRQLSWEAPDSRVRIMRHENLNEAPGSIPCRPLQDPEQWTSAPQISTSAETIWRACRNTSSRLRDGVPSSQVMLRLPAPRPHLK